MKKRHSMGRHAVACFALLGASVAGAAPMVDSMFMEKEAVSMGRQALACHALLAVSMAEAGPATTTTKEDFMKKQHSNWRYVLACGTLLSASLTSSFAQAAAYCPRGEAAIGGGRAQESVRVIREGRDGRSCLVRYHSGREQWVPAERLREARFDRRAHGDHRKPGWVREGARVLAFDDGRWRPARVDDVGPRKARVYFEDRGRGRQEWVDFDQLRRR